MDVDDDYPDSEFEHNVSSSPSMADVQIDEQEDYQDFIYQLCECTYLTT